jgi:hypothetical protein
MVNIFKDPRNYPFFLNKLEEHMAQICKIIDYCLMKNRFHLVVKTNDVDDSKMSRAFANLFTGYANAFNKTYARSGSLFKKPFKRKIITPDVYLKNVILCALYPYKRRICGRPH